MKVRQLLDSAVKESLQKILRSSLPIKSSMRVKTLIKDLEEVLAEYESSRKALVESLADKDENGGIITLENGNAKLSDDNMKAFVEALNKLQDEDIELTAIPVDMLADKVDITPLELMSLDDLISE